MKRILSYSMVLASALVAYACSVESTTNEAAPDNTDPGTDTTEPGTDTTDPGADGGTGGDAGPVVTPGTEDPSGNPILLGTARQVRSFVAGGTPAFVDGPQWSDKRQAIFVSLPLATTNAGGGGKGILTTFKSDGTEFLELRAGNAQNMGVVGNSVDKDGNLISAELRVITRSTVTDANVGAPAVIAAGYGGAEGVPETPFNAPNDLVALDDGTIFVTDPGYGVDPRPATGFLFRIAPAAVSAVVADSYVDNPSPNGIALSKDQSTLFVGFTAPAAGTLPFVRKYTINADRTLTNDGKFVELPLDSTPDGMAIDDDGNLYVALKTGIAVFKANGEAYGGAGAVPQTKVDGEPTSLTFGGADRKSLFVTTTNGKVLELKTKVPGLAQ